jgi:hypothetical protein
MLRPLTALLLGLLASTLPCLETPLVVQVGQRGDKVAVIDPAFGSVTFFMPSESKVELLGRSASKDASANFVADLDMLLKTSVSEREGVVFQALRTGTLNNKPTYGDMFNSALRQPWLPTTPTAREKEAGIKPVMQRAWAGQHAFWKTPPAYDGQIRAAFSQSGNYLAIAVPAFHALLVYKATDDRIELLAARNWGPELYMTGYGTAPLPLDMLQRVPKDKQADAKRALGIEEEDPKAAPSQPAEAAPGLAQQEEPPTPQSDVWIAGGGNDSFLLVDVTNSRAMLYQVAGKTLDLRAVRNLSLDLAIPALVGGGWNAEPKGEKLLEEAVQTRSRMLKEYNLPTDKDELLMMLDRQQEGGAAKASTFEATMAGNGIASLNFVSRRVCLFLNTKDGQSIDLAAARDYSLDTAVAMLDREINNRKQAVALVGSASDLARGGSRRSAITTLRTALQLDPRLHKAAETRLKNEFRNEAELQAQFEEILNDAAKRAEALAAEAAARKKALEEKRKAAQDKR